MTTNEEEAELVTDEVGALTSSWRKRGIPIEAQVSALAVMAGCLCGVAGGDVEDMLARAVSDTLEGAAFTRRLPQRAELARQYRRRAVR